MVKSYLRYVPDGSFGVISSNNAGAIYDHSGKLAICPALEEVIVWHIKQGVQIGRFHEQDITSEVTCMALSPVVNPGASSYRQNITGVVDESTSEDKLAVGYADGSIRIWDWKTRTCMVTLNGHKSAITVLSFDPSRTRLVSGSKDADIIMWDLVAETGLFRLSGHKDQVTSLHWLSSSASAAVAQEDEEGATGAEECTHLISSSKDTLIKIWDLTTRHCIETVVGHRSEVWSTILIEDGQYLISGTAETDLRVWKIDQQALSSKLTRQVIDGPIATDAQQQVQVMTLFGLLPRSSRERVAQLLFHPSKRYFACQTTDRTIEIYRIKTKEELKKKLRRRKRRAAEKATTGEGGTNEEGDGGKVVLSAADCFTSFRTLKTSTKVKSIDFVPSSSKDSSASEPENISVMTALANNSIDVYNVKTKDNEIDIMCSLELPGHRGEIRAMSLSSDDELLVTAGSGNLKVWNVKSQRCLRTLPASSTNSLCCAFLPGNRHVVVGTKTGELELYDTWSSTLLESIKAHDGAVWSIDVRPDKMGMASGGSDKEIKFWDFDTVEDAEYSTMTRKLTLIHTQTLKMTDEVLCIKYSPDKRLIAASLLDATIKVFYTDTLKFFLNMYGHKLPVLTMDISSDSKILISGSADKNIKIWGLDFGDCHKSIFAHSDSVTQVRFLPDSHCFFSCSKDKSLRYWDGDKFERIMTLEAHHAEVWAMCVSSRPGGVIVSSGHDRSIRLWRRTDDLIFLEEERERETEAEYEREIMQQQNGLNAIAGGADAQAEDESSPVSKMTMERLKAGERIVEALTLAEEEFEKINEWEQGRRRGLAVPRPEPNPLLVAMKHSSPEEHVLRIVEQVRSADLDEALLVLPFSKVLTLLHLMSYWIAREWNMPLTCRILVHLFKTHHNQIVASRSSTTTNGSASRHSSGSAAFVPIRKLLDSIRTKLRKTLQQHKDQIGFNIAAMRFMKNQWDLEHVSEFVDWERDMSQKAKLIQTGKRQVIKRMLPDA